MNKGFDANSNNIIPKNEKHKNASFVRTKKLENKEYEKERLELEKYIENKLDEFSEVKNSDTSLIPTISLDEFNKIKQGNKDKKLLKKLNKKDLKKKSLNNVSITPTISLKEHKNKKNNFFSKLIQKIKERNQLKKEKKLKIKIEKEKKLEEQKKLKEAKKLKLEEEKKQKILAKEQKKNQLNKENQINIDNTGVENSDKKTGLFVKNNVEKEKFKKLDLKKKAKADKIQKLEVKKLEKQRRLEEKNKIKLAKEEKRKEKLKLKVEEEAKRQKEKEEKIILFNNERKEKQKKIKQEREEAKKQRKEKLKLIKQAQEESKEKEKKERKTLEEKLKDWYDNLSFVRDRKNRRELQRQTLLIDFDGADAVRSEEKVMYKYVAKKIDTGKVENGFFAAFSKLDVHSFLIAEGYEVYEITPQKNFAKSLSLFSAKFKSTELDFFLTQLSTFLKSGITLIDSVKILSKQCKNNSQKNIYKSLIYELSMGENFSEALSKQGTIFPRLLVNMVKTSELTGDLPETLDDMANYYREMEKTRKQMISAITYPAVVLVFAFGILIFIMVSVIPQFVGIYKDLGTDLPAITVAIIKLSSFLQSYWMYVILGVIAFIVLFIVLFKSIKVFKTVIQSLIMNIPVFGKIVIYNEVTMFTKTFASLLNHNVYITDCMEVLSKITNNEIYKMLIFDTITNLAKGEAISNSFKNHWAFPTIAYEMILTGEKTGQLGNMMQKVSDYYQELHKNAVNQIKAFIEPVMIVVLAGIVGVVLLSVILPMFDMYQNIG